MGIYTQESREETPTNFQKYKNHTNTPLKQELQTKLQDKDISFMKIINNFQRKEMEYCDYINRLECKLGKLVKMEEVHDCELNQLISEKDRLEERDMFCNFNIILSSLSKQEQEKDERTRILLVNDAHHKMEGIKKRLVQVEKRN